MADEQNSGQLSSGAGISIVVDGDGGEQVPISTNEFDPLLSAYPSELSLLTLIHDAPSPAWMDGVGAILSGQRDHDYYNSLSQVSLDPDRYPPSPLQPFTNDDYYAPPSPLVPSFDNLAISSPVLPSSSTDFDHPVQDGFHQSDSSFDYPSPSFPNNAYSSGMSSPSFYAVDQSSALFGNDNKDASFDRLPSLRVDTVLSSPEAIQHSPSPLSDASPFSSSPAIHQSPSRLSDSSPYPSSPYGAASLTHSSPSSYSPHLSLHPSNYSTLSGALDESALSESGLDDTLDTTKFTSVSRRHSHSGLRQDVPSILTGTVLEESHGDTRKTLTFSGLGLPPRAGGSSRSAVHTPEVPLLQFEGLSSDVRGRVADRASSSTPGSRRVSRSPCPYSRPLPEAKDASQPSGSGHKRTKTYDQFLSVPGVPSMMQSRPQGHGNTHYRRHSTGNHPAESQDHSDILPSIPGHGQGTSRAFTLPTQGMHRPSASDGGITVPPMGELKTRFYMPAVKTEPSAPALKLLETTESLPERAGLSQRKSRVRASEEEPSGSEMDDGEGPKGNIRRETIASSATLKASITRRKNEAKFHCHVCHNGFTAKHNLQRHLLAHAGEKPYSCKCGQSFTNKWDRTRHRKKSRIPSCNK